MEKLIIQSIVIGRSLHIIFAAHRQCAREEGSLTENNSRHIPIISLVNVRFAN